MLKLFFYPALSGAGCLSEGKDVIFCFFWVQTCNLRNNRLLLSGEINSSF